MVFYFFVFFCVLGGHLDKLTVLLAWELNSGELDRHVSVFLRFLEMLKSQVCTCLSFSCFLFFVFIIFCFFLEALGFLLASFWSLCRLYWGAGVSFWVPLARVGCLWALSATFCSASGSPGLSVGSGTAPGLFFG